MFSILIESLDNANVTIAEVNTLCQVKLVNRRRVLNREEIDPGCSRKTMRRKRQHESLFREFAASQFCFPSQCLCGQLPLAASRER
jgi:hypothetical protein